MNTFVLKQNGTSNPFKIHSDFKAKLGGFEYYSPSDYIQRVESADGQPLEQGIKDAYTAFINRIYSDGLADKIKSCCILSGARTLAGCLVPLIGYKVTQPPYYIGPTTNSGDITSTKKFVEADYDRKTGLKGDGYKFLYTNTDIEKEYYRSNNHISTYITDYQRSPSSFKEIIGNGNVTITEHDFTGYNLVYFSNRSNAPSTPSSPANGSWAGLLATSRSNASSFISRINGTNYTKPATSPSLTPGNKMIVFGSHRTPSDTRYRTQSRMAWYSVGENIDLSLLDSHVSTLISDINNAI